MFQRREFVKFLDTLAKALEMSVAYEMDREIIGEGDVGDMREVLHLRCSPGL